MYFDGALPGGGVFEKQLCQHLKEFVVQKQQSNGIDEATAAVISKFAEALLMIPNTLAQNGCVVDGATLSIIDAAACKMGIISRATMAAINMFVPEKSTSQCNESNRLKKNSIAAATTAQTTILSQTTHDATPEKKERPTAALGMRRLFSPANKRKHHDPSTPATTETSNPTPSSLSNGLGGSSPSKARKVNDKKDDSVPKNSLPTIQTIKKRPCPVCHNEYFDKSTLNRHMKDIHNKKIE